MKKKFRLFRRGKSKIFWSQENATGVQASLRTTDRAIAERLLNAKNEAHQQPAINLQIARAYLVVSDPDFSKRTWQTVIDEILRRKRQKAELEEKAQIPETGDALQNTSALKNSDNKIFGKRATELRWITASKDKALSSLRKLPLLETTGEHFSYALERGKLSTQVFLRRIHNFAFKRGWLPAPVVPTDAWEDISHKRKNPISLEQHRSIVEGETNPERRAFYEMAWLTGASQSDLAFLEADNVDWETRFLRYTRKKSGEIASLQIGEELERILLESANCADAGSPWR